MVRTSESPAFAGVGIATDVQQAVISGQSCGECGVDFARPHGYAVLCRWCWDHARSWQRRGYQKAYHAEC